MSDAQDYPLGYSAQEAQRLADQGAQLEDLTEDVLRRVGLRGMRVLDLGSGAGDVSLLAARMVGSDGAVLGIDKALSSVEIARLRVAVLGVKNVHFEESDLAVFATDKKFDAIVGRFVLLYVLDRVMLLPLQSHAGQLPQDMRTWCESCAALLPLIERSGIANIAEIGIDTLAERLREDAVANDRVIFLSRVSAPGRGSLRKQPSISP